MRIFYDEGEGLREVPAHEAAHSTYRWASVMRVSNPPEYETSERVLSHRERRRLARRGRKFPRPVPPTVPMRVRKLVCFVGHTIRFQSTDRPGGREDCRFFLREGQEPTADHKRLLTRIFVSGEPTSKVVEDDREYRLRDGATKAGLLGELQILRYLLGVERGGEVCRIVVNVAREYGKTRPEPTGAIVSWCLKVVIDAIQMGHTPPLEPRHLQDLMDRARFADILANVAQMPKDDVVLHALEVACGASAVGVKQADLDAALRRRGRLEDYYE